MHAISPYLLCAQKWPSDLPNFKEDVWEMAETFYKLSLRIMETLAIGLNLPVSGHRGFITSGRKEKVSCTSHRFHGRLLQF